MSEYLAQRAEHKGTARIALRRVEHLYFKTDAVYAAMRRMTLQQQAAAAAGEALAAEEEAPDEGADLGEEDEPAEEAAAVSTDCLLLSLQ